MNKQKSWLLATGVATATLSLGIVCAEAASAPASPAPGKIAVAQAARPGESGTPTGVLSWGYPIGWGSEHEARMP